MKVIINAKVTPKVIPPGYVYIRFGDGNISYKEAA
jgi:hypothetical protein